MPTETQTDKLFRVRGKGVKPVRGGGPGDLICKVVVETPVNLTAKQKDLLSAFDKSIHDSKRTHDPRASTWLDSVKKFFEDLTS